MKRSTAVDLFFCENNFNTLPQSQTVFMNEVPLRLSLHRPPTKIKASRTKTQRPASQSENRGGTSSY